MATMKIQFTQFESFIKKSPSLIPVILIHGTDQNEIKLTRNKALELICGPNYLEEMRVSFLDETVVLNDPQIFYEKIKTIGFFPGKQALTIEGVTDKLSKALIEILKIWSNEDATIILISGSLKASSPIRKLIDEHSTAISIGIYEQQNVFKKFSEVIDSSRLQIVDEAVIQFIKNPNNFSSLSSFYSFIEKLELFKFSDLKPVSFEDIELLLEDHNSATNQEIINYLATGDFENMTVSLRKLCNMGLQPSQIINVIKYHFSLLLKVSLEPQNPDLILNKTYPPIFGHRRKQIVKHSKIWSTKRSEQALKIIHLSEKQMRSSTQVNINIILERACLKVAYLVNL